jgi:hypothetical protein
MLRSNAVNSWSLSQAGNFTISAPSAITGGALLNEMVGGSTISWCGSNAGNSWVLSQAGNFTTSVPSAITPTGGAPLNETGGGSTISWCGSNAGNSWVLNDASNLVTSQAGVSFTHIGTINNQAGTFVTDPAGFAVTRSGTFVTDPAGFVVTGSGTFVTNPASFAVTGSGTFEEARDWTSPASLYKASLSSSEPLIPQWELHNEYRELVEILREMAKLDQDEDLWVEEPVLDIALSVAVRLMTTPIPSHKYLPMVRNHWSSTGMKTQQISISLLARATYPCSSLHHRKSKGESYPPWVNF